MDEWDEAFLKLDKAISEDGDIPDMDDRWNASISKISKFDHVQVASFISPALDISDINMMIIVLPSTTRQDIMDDWQEICDYRDSLLKLFGKLKNSKLNYRQKVSRLHIDFGMGYGTIAKFLNYELILMVLYSKTLEEKSQTHEASYYEKVFVKHLLAFGYSESEAGEYLSFAKEEFQKERLPWHYRDGPLRVVRIRNHLREFSKEESIGWLETNHQFLEDYINTKHVEKKAREYFEKQFSINRSDEKFFRVIQETKDEILDEIVDNLKEAILPSPPDISSLNRILR